MFECASTYASHTRYCFSVLPVISTENGKQRARYRFAYTRPAGTPALTKEQVWQIVSQFNEPLTGGQKAFSFLKAAQKWNFQRRGRTYSDFAVLQTWRDWMTRHRTANQMDGRLLDFTLSDGTLIAFDCTLLDEASGLESPAAEGRSRTEVWRLHQIQPPWAPVFMAKLQASGTPGDSRRMGYDVQSEFYCTRSQFPACESALKEATRGSRTIRDHLRVCDGCTHTLTSAISYLSRDELVGLADWDGNAPVAVTKSLVSRIGVEGIVRVTVNNVSRRLRGLYRQLDGLTTSLYKSREVYEAMIDWMELSVDEPPRTP